MKLLLDIQDDKASFILELLSNFKFVKTKKLSPYKASVMEDVKEAVEEFRLVREGKLEAIPAKDMLDEL